jgi:hypothetical protein
MFNMSTILSIICLALLVFAAVLMEARRRYLKMKLDQRFCQLTRDAIL